MPDIILQILQEAVAERPTAVFLKSLLDQYLERGGLSKKQLEGLHAKASGIAAINSAKLSTLQAIINQKPNRYRSDLPAPTPLYAKDEKTGALLSAVLAKFPHHKRVLFLQAKFNNNEILQPDELREIQKFHKLLVEPKA
jgi:hypothetical protein